MSISEGGFDWGAQFHLMTTAAPYNAEKEAKEEKEAKDKKLAKIEQARKKAKEDKGLSMFYT